MVFVQEFALSDSHTARRSVRGSRDSGIHSWRMGPDSERRCSDCRAPLKIKVGERVVAGRNVIIRSISKKLYFGYETKYMEEAKDLIRVSDLEKTLIDLIYCNYPFLDEILPELAKKVRKEKLDEYLKRIKGVRGSKKIEAKTKLLFGK